MTTAGPTTYRFGNCEIDRPRRQVRVGGTLAECQPKAFDLLLYLIENRDRVVDKDELLEQLWPGMVVSESALTQALRKARTLIGDDGSRQALIRTVQRRGFRFVAALDEGPSAGYEVPATSLPPDPSVAVLPFVDMSPAQDQQYFCDGMAEEIINEITRATALRVAARTSAFAFKNRPDDVREIGRRLGVTSVLEGSVRKAGNRLRVTAQLVDSSTGFHLWSERWDRNVEDMFAIQDEIARLIAAALRSPGGPTGSATVTPGRPVAGVTPADLYRRGVEYQHRFGTRNQRFAIELFNQARRLDPEFARACAGLALSYILLYRYSEGTDANCAAAQKAATEAIRLDPGCAVSWTARGSAATLSRDFVAAEEAFERAITLAPDLFEAHYHYARACSEMGRFEKAVVLYERAAAIDPDDYQALCFAAQAYISLGRHDEAHQAFRRQLSAAERAVAADPTDARALSLSFASLLAAGRAGEVPGWITRSVNLEPNEPYIYYNAACGWALLGEPEQALDALERVNLAGMCNRDWMEHDESLDSLRSHPRFQTLLATACGPG